MSDFARKHLLFRDFLRSHPNTAREYYELKKSMAAKYGSDRRAYTGSKTTFIEAAVARARR
ncbi:MAG: GrpB family protein [Candidatus Bathyarchaeia archaeon]